MAVNYDGIGGFFQRIGDGISNAWDSVTGAIADVGNWVGDTFFGGSHSTNEANMSMNKENIAFQQQENEIARQREDNAVQRAAQDMTAAGLSKTLAAGNPASAQSMTAPSNNISMERNLGGLNALNAMTKLFFDKQANARANKLNDAQVNLIDEQTKKESITNETLAERLVNENALTVAKTQETKTMVDYYKIQTKVEAIIGKYKAESLEADIAKVYQDIAQSKKSMELTDAQIDRIYYESLNIAQDTLNKELSGKKTQKEIDLLAEDIVKAQLDALALKHDINYAQKYNYPVGTSPSGLLGSALGVGYSLGDRYKEDISSDNPSGLSKFIFNFTHPIWKWKF